MLHGARATFGSVVSDDLSKVSGERETLARRALATRALTTPGAVTRDVGGEFSSLDLKAIEVGRPGEPHTLQKHVAKSVEFLKERIASEGVSAASSYTDVAAAQRATDAIFADVANQSKMKKWIEHGMRSRLALKASIPGVPVGYVLDRADVASGRRATPTNAATAILQADLRSQTSYTILTTYPIASGKLA
ncbi:MAG: hypothetical protein NVS2B3_11400 [Vulcanimicrobiaceae bacterium]